MGAVIARVGIVVVMPSGGRALRGAALGGTLILVGCLVSNKFLLLSFGGGRWLNAVIVCGIVT